MDMKKVGKLIARLRKEKKITQQELAEKLGVTDRAVSKWERGLSLPDASLMIPLCEILEINVQDLLNGEIVSIDNKDEIINKLLLDMAQKEEILNKRSFLSMWIFMIIIVIFYIGLLLFAEFVLGETFEFGLITMISTVLFIFACLMALKVEVNTGYYECRKCHHKFEGDFKEGIFSMHFGASRYLTCPHCNKKSYAKKILKK